MKLLRHIRHVDLFPNSTSKDPVTFSHRRAARAIVINDKQRIALLYVTKHGYHKLPGGGIEEGEDIHQALERELLEEIGCRAKIVAEIGEIIEYRNDWDELQTSYCFLAQQVGEACAPDFTDTEREAGFAITWAPSIDAAIELLENDKPHNYIGAFIQQRDLAFLQAAKEHMSKI